MTKLTSQDVARTTQKLEGELVQFNRRYSGSAGERQPVHTVYGGAHLFKSDTTKKLGASALRILDEHGRDAKTFAAAIGTPPALASRVWDRVVEKLKREPVEDFRIDFEDGYGIMIKQGGRTGYWSPYNNSADPQNQTPTKPAATMADKIAVEPSGVCMNSAFHSSATGQDNYVGFSAKFHPNMPLTTSDLGDPYDVSKWDGITFRAKTGGGPTSQPVFVEILTKETQPTTAGGVATQQSG
jgi:hypothetical protein